MVNGLFYSDKCEQLRHFSYSVKNRWETRIQGCTRRQKRGKYCGPVIVRYFMSCCELMDSRCEVKIIVFSYGSNLPLKHSQLINTPDWLFKFNFWIADIPKQISPMLWLRFNMLVLLCLSSVFFVIELHGKLYFDYLNNVFLSTAFYWNFF